MVVSEDRLREVVEALRSFGARRVLLFGSAAHDPEHAQDIDLAEEGIPLRDLGVADLAVYRLLRAPFDLISREESPAFFDLVAGDAITLYEQE